MLNVVVEAVSDRPYPSRITTPGNVRSHSSMTSAGMGAPPDTATRIEDRSYFSRSGWLRTLMNMVGTPSKTVTRSRWTTSHTFAGSSRGISDIVPPNRTQTFITLDIP